MRNQTTIRQVTVRQASVRQAVGDEGYMLLAVVVLVFVVLLMLSIAAPRMAMALKHDQEIETKHRADQYVRAIRLYYRKTHTYPPSMEVLSQKTNGQRYLRQKYLDPLTGKDDWRVIVVGQNKTKVKGLFGQDLPGLSGGGLGSAAGMQSSPGGSGSAFNNSGTGGGSNGVSNGVSNGSSFGSSSGSSFGSGGGGGLTSTPQSGTGSTASGAGAASGPGSASGSSPGATDQNATDFKGSEGPIMGVGVPKDGAAILTVNEKTNYQDWEFLYDPRTEPTGGTGIGGGGTGTGPGLGTAGAPGTGGPGTGLGPSNPGTSNPGTPNPTSPTSPTNPTQPGSPTPQ